MAVKSQTALSTLTQNITYPTTTNTHSVRTHFVGEEPRSWTLMYPDCSRFWECGPAYETCLFECAACPCLQFPEQENDPQCNFQCEGKDGWQWANTFDEKWVLISKRIWRMRWIRQVPLLAWRPYLRVSNLLQRHLLKPWTWLWLSPLAGAKGKLLQNMFFIRKLFRLA